VGGKAGFETEYRKKCRGFIPKGPPLREGEVGRRKKKGSRERDSQEGGKVCGGGK